ncbi:MAG: hypothetical protein ABMA25_21660 [Ilumatobacteraceae bacterium]
MFASSTPRPTFRRAAALAAAVALVALGACSSESKVEGATTTSSVDAGSTTVDASSTTVAESTTTAAPVATDAPTTTAAAPETAAAPAPGYTAMGPSRLVMLPEDDNVFNVDEFVCENDSFFDFGAIEQCVQQDDLMVISYRIPESKRVVEAYLKVDTFWVEAYRTTEAEDFELAAIDLYIGDYAGNGYPAAFIGYRYEGSGGYLDFDIVQVRPEGGLDVRGIQGLDKGNVVMPVDEPGVVVSAVFADSDPNCCPSNMLFRDLAYVDGAWSLTDGTLSPTAEMPDWAFAF